MNKRQRLEATIAGQPVDRPAIALWRHWPGDDQRPADLARATVEFQRQYDWDLVKCMPASNYCLADWGVQSSWMGNEEGTRQWGPRLIRQPEDWTRLKVLDPGRGMLGEMLQAMRMIGQELDGDAPFIWTIFNPLAQAKNLAGDHLLSDLRQFPQEVKAGLKVITESCLRFVQAAQETGVAGIFLALQHATFDLLSDSEYREFGRPFDLPILEAAGSLWLNLLHLHGEQVMFDLAADYATHGRLPILNWHDQDTPPSLGQALPRFPGALLGGLHRTSTMLRGSPDDVKRAVRAAVDATGGRRLIVGTGCVLWITTPVGNIRAAREAVELLA
jgi:uroporphyrinogen decarboxylase